MNKRALLFTTLFCIISLQTFSNPIDVNKAKEIAHAFFNKSNNIPKKIKSISKESLQLVYTCSENEVDVVENLNNNYFYVFNRTDDNGFVIVSADDNNKSILGYTDSGSFDLNDLPDGLKYWLECTKAGLKKSLPLPEALYTSSSTSDVQDAVEPLLGNIAYNQDTPYNNFCPSVSSSEKAVTGCVATAMSQIMRFHKYPVKGYGSHFYTTETLKKNITANFGNTTYDWDNMLETYKKGKYTTDQAEAVATLVYHCGVAVNMDYNSVSSAMDFDIPSAFVNYFNYEASTIKLCGRDFYTSTEWLNLIKQELDANRPLIYNGQSMAGGHSFVCDGYDSNGLFHINWGWGGQSNGYFDLNILDPGIQGIGGGIAGFNYNQSIIIGIQPSMNGGHSENTAYELKAMGIGLDKDSIAGFINSQVTIVIANYGTTKYSGNIGIAMIGDNDKKYIDFGAADIVPGAIIGYGRLGKKDFKEGTYKLYPAYKPEDSEEWKLMPMPISMPEYITAITQNQITLLDTDNAPQALLEISDFKVVGELVTNKNGIFEFTATNAGKEFNQALLLMLIDPKSPSKSQIAWIEGTYLADGESRTIQYNCPISLKAGTYYAMILIYGIGGSYIPTIDEPYEITVKSKASSITEINNDGISIYPNPVTTKLQIDSDEPITNIHILNISGQEVISKQSIQSDRNSINVEGLPSGSYILRLEMNDKILIHKFIKK